MKNSIPHQPDHHKHRRRLDRKRRKKIHQQMANAQRRIQRRLDRRNLGDLSKPVLSSRWTLYDKLERFGSIGCGGIGVIHNLALELGLPQAINNAVQLLDFHLPYFESDYVLTFAYNALCGGTCLEDIERLRQDENFLNALDARRLPDPTTAGDFCRRFESATPINDLQDVFDEMRLKVWARQPSEFFERADIDADGHLLETLGNCKQGMDIAYDGTWGYHPALVSLANTGELLRIKNRSGNRPSHEGVAEMLDQAIQLCFRGGFRSVRLRGDTDFSQTKHLDRWNATGRVQFVFGYDALPKLQNLAADLPAADWQKLKRPAKYKVKTEPRARPENVKDRIVKERGFEKLTLEEEHVAEFPYQPTECKRSYRMIALRKTIRVEKGQKLLFPKTRHFFYITNDRQSTAAEIVFTANDRCNQENLIAQLSGQVRAFRAPVDNLYSNWAYMVMTGLAWNLKAWLALRLPESGPDSEPYRQDKLRVLRMEFKTFVNAFIRVPCQIVRTARQLVYRVLAWSPWQPILFRVIHAMRC